MVFPVGRRVIIEGFWATTILPPINGFFFAFSVVVNVARFFWVSWGKKKNPVGAGPVGQHGSFVGQASFFKDSRHLKGRVLVCDEDWFVVRFFLYRALWSPSLFLFIQKFTFFFVSFFSFFSTCCYCDNLFVSSCDFFYLVFV